jgi:hypothetical protein
MEAVMQKMAEGEGFEPPSRSLVKRFSRPPPSTTRPSLRGSIINSITMNLRIDLFQQCQDDLLKVLKKNIGAFVSTPGYVIFSWPSM